MNVLTDIATARGWTPLGEVVPRSLDRVGGRVAYVEVTPHDTAARLVVRIQDPTGAMDLIFLGRRMVPGLEPGVILCAAGRIVDSDDVPVMYNPRYELCQS